MFVSFINWTYFVLFETHCDRNKLCCIQHPHVECTRVCFSCLYKCVCVHVSGFNGWYTCLVCLFNVYLPDSPIWHIPHSLTLSRYNCVLSTAADGHAHALPTPTDTHTHTQTYETTHTRPWAAQRHVSVVPNKQKSSNACIDRGGPFHCSAPNSISSSTVCGYIFFCSSHFNDNQWIFIPMRIRSHMQPSHRCNQHRDTGVYSRCEWSIPHSVSRSPCGGMGGVVHKHLAAAA